MSTGALQWVARYRGRLIGGLILSVGLCPVQNVPLDMLFWSIGLLVIAGGVAMRIWARQHKRDCEGHPIGLATTGPYAIVRHPLYLGNTLLFVGVAILSEQPWAPPIVLVWCGLVYSVTARWEESRCRKKYGTAYEAYLKQVPRWWPTVRCSWRQSFWTTRMSHAAWAEWPCYVLVVVFVLRELLMPDAS